MLRFPSCLDIILFTRFLQHDALNARDVLGEGRTPPAVTPLSCHFYKSLFCCLSLPPPPTLSLSLFDGLPQGWMFKKKFNCICTYSITLANRSFVSSLSLSVCNCLFFLPLISLSLSLSVSLSLCLSLSLSLSVSLSLSLSIPLCLSLALSMPPFPYLFCIPLFVLRS